MKKLEKYKPFLILGFLLFILVIFLVDLFSDYEISDLWIKLFTVVFENLADLL